MSTKLWYLSNSRLFAGMSEKEMQEVERMTEMSSTPRFSPIYLQGDQANNIYLLKKGQVRISRLSEQGNQVVLSILGPGDIFGELAITGDDTRNEIAEAMEETLLCAMRREDFEMLLQKNGSLSLKVTKLIGLRLKHIQNRVEDLAFRSASGRLASLLIRLADEHGVPHVQGTRIGIRLTQQDLANLLGLSRQTVSLTLNEWKESGWLAPAGQQIVISEPEQLREFANV